jgi:NitT/TauT family transport system substrate-binding protein
VLDNDASGAQTKGHQVTQMAEIAKLVEGGKPGYLEPAAYERTVTTLLTGKSDPVITKKPAGAWTHAIWDKAQK